jgi:hypothetical protein
MQEMAFQNFSGGVCPQTPLFMRGMLATQVAISHCCPSLYCLTERSLFKKCPPPPPHGKILKKGPDQYTKKNQLNVCLHITFIFLTTPHVVHTCDSVIGHKLNYIPGVPKKTIPCLISCTVKPITAISLK